MSREFKELVAPKDADEEDQKESGIKILYYNAFTEDLFYWDNDLDADTNRKFKIQPNNFTKWVLQDQGQENNIVTHFQHYTSDKLSPRFNEEYITKDKDNQDITISAYSEITFSIARGDDRSINNIKISKGEESCLIWCVFYSLLEQVVEVLNVAEPSERETDQFNDLEYVFIDDPVSSLDDNHLIELAVNLAELIKKSNGLKFIISTHNPLFYNVLFNEFNNADSRYHFKVKHSIKRRLEKLDDGTYLLEDSKDSPFSYHLFLLSELEKAIDPESGNIQKYHFNFLRNVLEKTSTFLGYSKWEDLLPQEARRAYYNRIINLSSHSKHHGEEISIVDENDKRVLRYLINEVIIPTYHFRSNINNKETEENGTV
ncbi:AAA family ATPase [Bacteroides xylanisolvens]|uniref:AAA family ATPase n=1 Tax=Bacteroides xylanisolvens TaxID=371601 RepID=UPI0023078224|nr:AAA family ATPase [Bacteroides xylanisolvens]MDB0719464.1 AAA family ATPase [Bacteroides xylanisolvens]